MKRSMGLMGMLLGLCLVTAACSDENEQQVDGGAPVARECEKKCLAQETYYCVTSARGRCVECATDYHCTSNPGSLGSKCTKTGLCNCASDADCKGKTHGGKCDSKLKICSCSSSADCPSPGTCDGEISGVKVCKPECTKDSECTDDDLPFCDASAGKCVGCKADTDCAAGTSFGNKCVKGTTRTACGCKADADCVQNRHGATCSSSGRCSCVNDSQCKKAPYSKCNPTSSTAYTMYCTKPCTSDTECGANLKCHKATGRCSACARDADCTGSYKYCNLTLGKCVACKKNADCTDKAYPHCSPTSGRCVECVENSTCLAGYKWGNRCIQGSTGSASCGCQAAADCAGNPHGATCNTLYRRCTCKSNAECKKAPYVGCYMANSYSTYMHCQQACKADSSCGYGLRCDKASGRCLQCKADADCKSSTNKYCHAALGKCVACKSSTDCKSASLPTCDPATGSCVECAGDADCKKGYFWGNKCVTSGSYLKVCRCSSNADCAGNPRGPTCYGYYQRCTCSSNSDCKAPYTLCERPYGSSSYKYCQKPCSSYKDCTSSQQPYCDKTSGKCAGCLSNANCAAGSSPICDTTTGTCGKCKSNSDCAASLTGGYCDTSSGYCGCKGDSDCAKSHVWGDKCLTYGSSKVCRCLDAAGCKGNVNGPVCNTYYRRCTCIGNKDCTRAPNTVCAASSSTSQYAHCQKPCKTDNDCVAPGLTKCFLGKCIAP